MSQNEIYMKFTDEKLPFEKKKFNETIKIFEVSPAGDYAIINFQSNSELKFYKTSDWEEEPLGRGILEQIKQQSNWNIFVRWTDKGIFILEQDNSKANIKFLKNQLNERFHPNLKFNVEELKILNYAWESIPIIIAFCPIIIEGFFVFVFESKNHELILYGGESELCKIYGKKNLNSLISIDNVNSINGLDRFSFATFSILTDSSLKIIMAPLDFKSSEIYVIKEINNSISCFNYDVYRDHFVMGYSDGKILSCPAKFIFLDIPLEEISNIVLSEADHSIDRVFTFENQVIFLSNNTVYCREYPKSLKLKSEIMHKEIFDDFKNKYLSNFEENIDNIDWLKKFKFLYFCGETIWMKALKHNNDILKELLDLHLKLMKNINYRNLLAFFEFEPLYYLKEENKNNNDKSALLDYILKDSPSKTQILVLDLFSSSSFTVKFSEEIAQDSIKITGDITYIFSFDQIRELFQQNIFIMNNLKILSLTNGIKPNLLMVLYKFFIEMKYLKFEFFARNFFILIRPIVIFLYTDQKNLMIKYTFGLISSFLGILLLFLVWIIEEIIFLTIHLTLFLGETALTLLVAPDRIKTTILKYKNTGSGNNFQDSKESEGTERLVKIVFISVEEADRIFKTLGNFPQSHPIFQSEVLATLIEHRWENETKYIFFRRIYLYLLILVVISIDILYLFALRPSFDDIGQFNIVINMVLNGSILIHQVYMFWEEQTEMKDFNKYITNIWNILDIILIYSGIFAMTYDLYNLVTFKESDNLLKYTMVLFFFLAWFRFLEYLRGIRATSTLLTLLSRVGMEMYGFLFVLLFLIAGLAFTCFLLQSSYDHNNPWDMFQYMYFLLLGDFDGYNSLYKEQPETTSIFYRTGFFLIFFISTIFIVIVMLNLLIAIISDAYEKVMLDIKSNETYETLYLINQERNKNSNPKGREEYFERMRNRRIIYLPEHQEEGSDSKDRVRTKITRIEQKLKEQGEEYNRKHLELTKANTEIISANTEIKGAIKRIEEQISKIVQNTK